MTYPFTSSPHDVLQVAITALNEMDGIGAGPGWTHRAIRLLQDPAIARAIDDGLSAARIEYNRKTRQARDVIDVADSEYTASLKLLAASIAALADGGRDAG